MCCVSCSAMIVSMHRVTVVATCVMLIHFVAFEVFHAQKPTPRRRVVVTLQPHAPAVLVTTPEPVTEPEPPKKWKYDRRVCSGLGDRMCLFFIMAGLGRVANAIVYVRWCEEGQHGGSRTYDIESYKATLGFPEHVIFVPDGVFDMVTVGMADVRSDNTEIIANEGYDCCYAIGQKTFRAPAVFNSSDFTRAYQEEGREWALPKPAPEDRYVILHVRGDDKQDMNINDFCTVEAVRAVAAVGLRIVVVTDDRSLADSVIQHTDNIPVYAADSDVYNNVALIHGAAGVLQHAKDGWSSFSSSVVLFRGVPLLNTWRGGYNRIREFERVGGKTWELRMCEGIDGFVADVHSV